MQEHLLYFNSNSDNIGNSNNNSISNNDIGNQNGVLDFNKQGIAETAKTNGPTCDNMCIQKI